MFIRSKMVTFLVVMFLGYSVVAKESENCDRVQFSFRDQNSTNTNQNFTKQSLRKNGQPVYYSYSEIIKNHDEQTIIWRNKENNTWLSKTRTWIGNKINKTKTKTFPQTFFIQGKVNK